MRCAITGAAGYVGSSIASRFRMEGWDVLELGRRRSSEAAEHFRHDLTNDPKAIPWAGVDALVHCAYDFRLTQWEEIQRVNIDGSVRLFETARENGVKHGVFISSLSSFDGCRSLYGKAKLIIEAEALRLGFAVVRPGLVWGANPGGMMGSLTRAASGSSLLPLIGDGSYPQYLVRDEDLARLVFELCKSDAPTPRRPVSAAHPEKVSLRALLERIASRHGRKPVFIGIPWRLLLFGLKAMEALRLPAPFRSDSLIGIVYQNPAPDFSLPELPQVTFRRFE